MRELSPVIMESIFDGSVSGLTLKRTMCSMICVDILMGEMGGGDEEECSCLKRR